MISPKILDLMHGYLDGCLSESELEELDRALRESAEARALLRSLATIDTKWESAAANVPVGEERKQAAPSRLGRWRVSMAAAAGVVFGLVSGSLMGGFSAFKTVDAVLPVKALADGRFETLQGDLAHGFPLEFGKWGGDPACSARWEAGPVRSALRFMSVERERPSSVGKELNAPRTCDVYQLVDLRPLRSKVSGDPAPMLELSADFLDARTESGADLKFICHVQLFGNGEVGDRRSAWLGRSEEALSVGRAHFLSHGGDATWKRLTVRCVMPPEAEQAVIWLAVAGTDRPQIQAPVLGNQYVSNVNLLLKTRQITPTQQVRP